MGCSLSAHVLSPVVPPVVSAAKFEDKYSLGEQMAHGSFGEVYAGHRLQVAKSNFFLSNVQYVAVKVIKLQIPAELVDNTEGSPTPPSGEELSQKHVSMELTTWQRIGTHRHCVCLFEAFIEGARAYFVMERCQCAISHMLLAKPVDTVQRTRAIFSQMLQGIAHVHSVGIVHRDVKPDNFLVGGHAGDVIKLCDFGLAALLPQAGSVDNGKLGGTHGTPAFMSPEMLLAAGYDEKTDVWSLGAMCYCILFGSCAYAPKTHRVSEMKDAIRVGTPGPDYRWHGQCRTCVMELLDVDRFEPFLKQTLQRDPNARPAASAMSMELPSPEDPQPYVPRFSVQMHPRRSYDFGDMKPIRLCSYGTDDSTRDGSSSIGTTTSTYAYRSTGSSSR